MPPTQRAASTTDTPEIRELRGASPDTDRLIAHRYSLKDPKDRALNRTALMRELGWTQERHLVVFVPLALIDDAGHALLREVLPAFADHDIQVLVLGPGATELPHVQHVIARTGTEGLFRQALAGADVVLLPGLLVPRMLPQALAWRYGAVPVVPGESSINGMADDYDPVLESGTSFLYRAGSVWSLHAALVRALETFRLPYDWHGVQRNGMELGWG